jgi:isopentenyldiphosphate isomerase
VNTPKPQVQIVDENDVLIGLKERTAIDYSNDIYRSSCIWIENPKDEVLLVQRAWSKDKDPGMWGTAAAGTIDEGETYEGNAYKELEEEIGLTGVELTYVTKFRETNPRNQFIKLYIGKCDVQIDDLKLQKEEVETAVWIAKSELKQDYAKDPGKYVPLMPKLIKQLIS